MYFIRLEKFNAKGAPSTFKSQVFNISKIARM